jgi:hypothetical protein
MPKVFVVIENSHDGHPIWDEAEFRMAEDIVRPSHRLSYQERDQNFKKTHAQNADRYHRTQARAKKHISVQRTIV